MPRKSKNIAGRVFGELTVVDLHHKEKGEQYWLCRCTCGKEVIKRKRYILHAGYPVCGNCFDRSYKRPTDETAKVYSVWAQMKQRCYNPKRRSYVSYGLKGVTICERWKGSFENFYKDMGPRLDGAVLGRIDTGKGYYKENCIWATRKELTGIHALLK